MSTGELALVILAAGDGTRMRSQLPKVLHPVCGRSILGHQLRLGREIGAKRFVVVVGRDEARLRAALAEEHSDVELVRQAEPLGTAHAALAARETLREHRGPVLLMYGDHPLYRSESFAALLDAHRKRAPALTMLVTEFPDPSGYGRVVRDAEGRVARIVEETEADAEVRAIAECNLGAYLAEADFLFETLAAISNDNERGEYFLTDLVELTLAGGGRVETAAIEDWTEALGINSRVQLARAEALMRERIAVHWMREGVTLTDPAHTYIDADVEIGADTVIAPGAYLKGGTRVGSGCRIDVGSVLEDATLGDDVWIKPHCWLEEARLGSGCIIGPSAHLRPGALLEDEVRVGNYVEIKNSRLGRGTKADHLSYVGDADVGAGVTIGCGAITVNYDGQDKHRTTIGDGAFVGCNANLIAPVEIEPQGYVAAGSTITTQVPTGSLAVARARQRNISGWRERRFAKSDED